MVSSLGNSNESLWKRKISGEQIAQYQIAKRIEEMEVHSSGQIEIWTGEISKTAAIFQQIQLPKFSSEKEFSVYLDGVSWKATQDSQLNEYYLKVSVRGLGGGGCCSSCGGNRKSKAELERDRQDRVKLLNHSKPRKPYFRGVPLSKVNHTFSNKKLNTVWQAYKHINRAREINDFLLSIIKAADRGSYEHTDENYDDSDFPAWIDVLLEVGANVNPPFDEERFVLERSFFPLYVCCTMYAHEASYNDHRRARIAVKLLQMGASGSDQRILHDCIRAAIENNRNNVFSALLKYVDINRNLHWDSLLDVAIKRSNSWAAIQLIEAGADLTKGEPLELAARYGLDDVRKLLVSKPEFAEKERLRLKEEEEHRRKLEAQREQIAEALSQMILLGLSANIYIQLDRVKLIDELKKRISSLLLTNLSESLVNVGVREKTKEPLTRILENLLTKKNYFDPETIPPHIDWKSIEKYIYETIQELKAAISAENFLEQERKHLEEARRKFEEEGRQQIQKKDEEIAQVKAALLWKDKQDREQMEKLQSDLQKIKGAAEYASLQAYNAAYYAREASLGRPWYENRS